MKKQFFKIVLLLGIPVISCITVLPSCSYSNDDDQTEHENKPDPEPEPEPEPDPEKYTEALKLPNCYMVKPGESVSIPVLKAFAVWNLYSDELLSQDISFSEFTPVPELLWQDESGLITSVGLLENIGEDSQFVVATAAKTGNAVVVVRFGGIIRWSWHIWVTGYDPNADQPQQGKTFTWDNNDDGVIDYVFMDRDLGARSDGTLLTATDSLAAYGLYYQYGRKDPFPQDITGKEENIPLRSRPLYRIDGSQLPSLGNGNDVGIRAELSIAMAPGTIPNLARSILNPLTLYFGKAPVSDIGDWYSYQTPRECNDELWEKEGAKAAFDPCPEGWQVPPHKNKYPEYEGTWNSDLRKPWWINLQPFTPAYSPLGVFPFSGEISGSFGTTKPEEVNNVFLILAGRYYMTNAATPATFYGNGARNAYGMSMHVYNDKATTSTDVRGRSTATTLRCVKEDKTDNL